MLFVAYHKNKRQTQHGLFLVAVFWGRQTAEMLSAGVLEEIQIVPTVSAYLVPRTLLCSSCFFYRSCTIQSSTQANVSQNLYSGLSARLENLILDTSAPVHLCFYKQQTRSSTDPSSAMALWILCQIPYSVTLVITMLIHQHYRVRFALMRMEYCPQQNTIFRIS